jgi:hypothetical protein
LVADEVAEASDVDLERIRRGSKQATPVFGECLVVSLPRSGGGGRQNDLVQPAEFQVAFFETQVVA